MEFAESGCLIFRATTPLSRSKLKSKGRGKLSIHLLLIIQQVRPFFAKLFVNQQTCVKNFEFHQDRSGQPDVLMGQSIILSEIKEEVSLQKEIPSHQNVLLQRYE